MSAHKFKAYVGDSEPTLDAVKAVDSINNGIVAYVQQKKLLKDTAERNEIPEDKIEEFLYRDYKKEESKEYLVDGAILTCTCSTKQDIDYLGEIYKCPLEEERIKKNVDTNLYENRFLQRLIVTENPTSSTNDLQFATIEDRKKKDNIPYFGNCVRLPDNSIEKKIFEDHPGREYEEGTCSLLINLEDKWENYDIGQTFLNFPDDDGKEKMGITMTSILFCKHGGFVYPVTSGQTIQAKGLYLIYEAREGTVTSGKSPDGGPQAGILIKYDKTSYEPKSGFGKSTPNYYILNHQNAYIDENGLVRIKKNEGVEMEDDYYCVAMSPGFATAAEKTCSPPQQGNINYGYTLQIQLENVEKELYTMDVVIADAKASEDEKDFHTHDHLIEFIVDQKPGDAITNERNVSYDKLLGGSGLEIKRIYAYEDGALVEGGYWPEAHWRDR